MLGVMAALFLLSAPVQAQTTPSCVSLHVPQPSSRYALTQAHVIGLTYALSAWSEGTAFDKEKDSLPPANLLVAMMRHTKAASEAYACAEQVITPYEKSQDQKMIGVAAQFLVAVYQQHRRLNNELLDMLRSLSDKNDMVQLADRISTGQVERGKLWKDLVNANQLIALSLIDLTRTGADGNVNAIVLTRAERQNLLDQLERNFVGVKALAAGAPMPTTVAGILYSFLTKPYKCADE